MTITAPDLKNGHIINGRGQPNNWMTEIQSALTVRSEDGEKTIYLSQECRAEGVPFLKDGAQDPSCIFQKHNILEFLTCAQSGDTLQVSTNDIYIAGPDGHKSPLDLDRCHPSTEKIPISESRVSCPERGITILTAEELLNRLRSGGIAIRDVFMKVSWKEGGKSHEMFCPCRYINFSDGELTSDAYVQPISGYALFMLEDTVLISYAACAVNMEGRTIIEFCCRRYRNVFSYFMEKNPASQEMESSIGKLAQAFPILASQFDMVVPVEGECVFYQYV